MVATTAPAHFETRCPISPDGAPYQYSHSSQYHHGVTSPSNNSDNNYYQSPVLSPGDWNVASPASNNVTSPYSSNASWKSFDSSVQGSPLSAPAALATPSPSSTNNNNKRPPKLPSELGTSNTEKFENMTDTQRRKAMERVNKKFISKTSIDQEREKSAVRKANSLMNVTHGRARPVETKKIMVTNKKPVGRVVIVPNGKEHLATSTWKGRKNSDNNNNNNNKNDKESKQKLATIGDDAEFEENVDDFKCELDRDREKWAQKQALKMLRGAGNFL